MTRESLAFAISGTCFGLLVGWMIGSQQAGSASPAPAPAAAAGAVEAPAFDADRAAELEQRAGAEATNAAVRVELGQLYADAKQFDRAVFWYEGALAIDPKNVDAGTGLAVAYYNTNQIDRSLEQFDRTLAIDPSHLRALLYQGVVRAFGRQDLEGAAKSWERVVALAPDSEEGRQARQGLDGIKAAHPGTAPDPQGAGTPP